jgi:hypothetical protein
MFAHKIMDELKNLDFITDMYSSNEHSVLPLDVRCTGVQFNSAYEILSLDGWKSLDEVGLSADGITVQGIEATIDEILGV